MNDEKVVCNWSSTPHAPGGCRPGDDPRPAQPQAPAPSLDARVALREIFLEAGFLTNDPQASRRAIRELAEAALVAPSAPSDALWEALVTAKFQTYCPDCEWSVRGGARDRKVTASFDTCAPVRAALVASPSVIREEPSCYACGVLLMVNPREVCESCARLSEEEQDDRRAEWVPAPTAPKEPQ